MPIGNHGVLRIDHFAKFVSQPRNATNSRHQFKASSFDQPLINSDQEDTLFFVNDDKISLACDACHALGGFLSAFFFAMRLESCMYESEPDL